MWLRVPSRLGRGLHASARLLYLHAQPAVKRKALKDSQVVSSLRCVQNCPPLRRAPPTADLPCKSQLATDPLGTVQVTRSFKAAPLVPCDSIARSRPREHLPSAPNHAARKQLARHALQCRATKSGRTRRKQPCAHSVALCRVHADAAGRTRSCEPSNTAPAPREVRTRQTLRTGAKRYTAALCAITCQCDERRHCA